MRRNAGSSALAAVVGALLVTFVIAPAGASAPASGSVSHAATWSIRLLATGDTSFHDVACGSATACVAVGGGPGIEP